MRSWKKELGGWTSSTSPCEYHRQHPFPTLGARLYNEFSMSIYDDRREELEKHELMMGAERGRLAITLDLLTDALVLVGQHGVYCQSARQAGKPAMDIQMISKCLTDAKELVASVMEQIQRKKAEVERA